MEIRQFKLKENIVAEPAIKASDSVAVVSSNTISNDDIKTYSNASKAIAFTSIKPSKELIIREIQSGKKIKEIREIYGFTEDRFNSFCKKNGITTPRQQALANSQNITKEQIETLMAQGLSQKEIAKALGVKPGTITAKIHEFGIETNYYERLDNSGTITKELLESYIDEGKTNDELAEIFNVSSATILNKKRKFNIASSRKDARKKNDSITKEDITSRLEKGMTREQICEELGGIPFSSYQRLLKRHGIQTSNAKALVRNREITKEDIQSRIDAGMSVKQIQEELGIKKSQWIKKLKELGIQTKDTEKYKRADMLTQELLENERSAGLSVAEIAKKYNIGEKSVYKRMHLYGISLPQPKLKKAVDITKEEVLQRLEQGKSHDEIREEFGLSKDKYRYRLASFQIETDLQIQRKRTKEITKEQLLEAMQGKKTIEEIAEVLGVSPDTCAVKMKEFGFATETQTRRSQLNNISAEDIISRLKANMSQSEICKELGIGDDKYYGILNENNIITSRKQSILAAKAITREQLLSITESNKSVKEICEELGLKSDDVYYGKLNEFGLSTANQKEKERIESIPREKILCHILSGKSTSELCKIYKLSPRRCKTLLKKHGLTVNIPPSKIDYKQTSAEELKDHIANIYCETETLSDDDKIGTLVDFLSDKQKYSPKEFNQLIKLSQLFDGLSAKLTTPKEIIKTTTFKHLDSLRTQAEEHFAEINLHMEGLITYLSNFKEANRLMELCYKYQPKSPTDTNLANSDYLINKIRTAMVKGNVGQAEAKSLGRELAFWDREVSNPKDEVLQFAKDFATDKNGVVNKEKGGLFLEKYEQFENLDFADYSAHLIEALMESGTELKAQDAVPYLIKFEEWQAVSDKEKTLLNPFLEMFDTTNSIDNSIVSRHIENVYNKLDTPITSTGRPGTVTASLKQDTVFSKKAKEAITKKYPYPANIKIMSKFEDAMQYIVPSSGQYGIKQMPNGKKYNWEVKINDTDRLVSSDNSFVFDTYVPEGFHTRKKGNV